MTMADFKVAIGQAYWDINYVEFCRRAGWPDDNYSEGKWRQWLKLVECLKAFDADTLARIVQP